MTFGGTIRLTDTSLYNKLFSTLTLRVQDIASAYGCSATVIDRNGETRKNSRGEDFTIRAFPPNVNDDAIVDLGISLASKMYGEETTTVYNRKRTGCEDFAFVSELVPAAQFRIGTKLPEHQAGEKTGTQGHNPLFDIDEKALPRGSAFMSTFALEYLLQKSNDSKGDEL